MQSHPIEPLFKGVFHKIYLTSDPCTVGQKSTRGKTTSVIIIGIVPAGANKYSFEMSRTGRECSFNQDCITPAPGV